MRRIFTMMKPCHGPVCRGRWFTITSAASVYCQNKDCQNARRRADRAARKSDSSIIRVPAPQPHQENTPMSLNKAQPVVDGDGVIQTGLNATPKSVDEIVAEAQANIAQAIDASAHESLPASVSAQVAKVVTDSATDMLLAERDQRLMAFIQAVDRGQTTPTLERAEGETRDQWMPRVCKALGVPLPATTIVEGDVIATLIKFRDQIEFPQADESLMDEKQLAAHQAGEIIDEAEYDASMHAAKSATGELDIASLEIAADPDAVTPWFSGDVDPVHFGEYECMNPVDGSYFRATYDPMFEEWTSGGAACIWQFPTWRGLLAPAS